MCGIFGFIPPQDQSLSTQIIHKTIDRLFLLSESRGKEASGAAFLRDRSVRVYKEPKPAKRLIVSRQYQNEWDQAGSLQAVMGHARLVTNGSLSVHANNQPVVKDNIVAIHNGIIVNDTKIWGSHPTIKRSFEVDTEIIPSLLGHWIVESEQNISTLFARLLSVVEGTVSVGVMFAEFDQMVIGTNNGSMYVFQDRDRGMLVFASERYILQTLLSNDPIFTSSNHAQITQIQPGEGMVLNLRTNTFDSISIHKTEPRIFLLPHEESRFVEDISPTPSDQGPGNLGNRVIASDSFKSFEHVFENRIRASESLRRCRVCILPETMPFITFNQSGVCNYCEQYHPIHLKGRNELESIVTQHKKTYGPKCLVTFSGGRDSSYALHILKTELGMDPTAYSYDWGMLTDLGRRNQARMCGKLGVEHILVSADIRTKRMNIKKNVLAWLKRPDLGMVPLFMAGDKQYFFYANQLRKRLNLQLVVLGSNMLEKTDFKTGFCNIGRAAAYDDNFWRMSAWNSARLGWYYLKQFAYNPAYFNSSLLDTLGAYASYYLIPHDYLNLFQYIAWDERVINETLTSEYAWEKAEDTSTTWRIGDGTAAFYNYIYFYAAGFTESDTFRSNQIREGMISRTRALELASADNRPRFRSLQWYCDTLGIDTIQTLTTIGSMRTLY